MALYRVYDCLNPIILLNTSYIYRLRFMQRGATQRVSTSAAKVADEAEWDIGPAARAAWGVSSNVGPTVDGQSSSCVYV